MIFITYLIGDICVDGPVVDVDFSPATDTLALSAMGTPSEFDRRKKKK